ncbi:putative 3-oxo-5-alpha-steroid 4-dehydrogenase 1 [Monocercomonoides exilis]|uniref:putative 3-oxo-5-alpha-steroid 4-dehydrogenase 1 n=1 Tax=Monocercomonoides exilis TaxID=2049356 RepID=UPI00355A49EE|nr:putative 3-oxo-5-alpha-steroid 4-dehydrogenase 1 [Monocercomonoides exilis]|eukprot:MONOS_4083.1-p1 / transcript=MONOS_4083.1 / gene=MONOS_4083 / organism=Monocercomonoides_exilis_PA203 / gene_product=3-oxo-5-alpha-steroid 4-dehydrogenase 1 / transcript_product=3-oxo-5-alpha-steroid 4-dehydrogenase 1 / location=Mono_scaffold00104:22623-23736(+) / protein_length=257 / sequence_SO=supercontig / SO=protein_coding / is_pseudo=false
MDLYSIYIPTLFIWIFVGIIVFFVLFFITAPYGRHANQKSRVWGPWMSGKYAFLVMELPGVILPLTFVALSSPSLPILFYLLLWMIHYINRVFIMQLRKQSSNKNMPLIIALMASTFQFVNCYLVWFGMCFVDRERFDNSVFLRAHTYIGALIFFTGFFGNVRSDEILLHLRKPGDNNYYIPHGFLFEYVSSPNYFCEILEWFGFAVSTGFYPASLVFFIWTGANLAPRAISHHKWYKQKFGSKYPPNRKALIPFIV